MWNESLAVLLRLMRSCLPCQQPIRVDSTHYISCDSNRTDTQKILALTFGVGRS